MPIFEPRPRSEIGGTLPPLRITTRTSIDDYQRETILERNLLQLVHLCLPKFHPQPPQHDFLIKRIPWTPLRIQNVPWLPLHLPLRQLEIIRIKYQVAMEVQTGTYRPCWTVGEYFGALCSSNAAAGDTRPGKTDAHLIGHEERTAQHKPSAAHRVLQCRVPPHSKTPQPHLSHPRDTSRHTATAR